MEKIKQFLKNKNTVTFLGIIVAVLVLYFSYNYKVNQATRPIKVPVAKEAIEPRTKITSEMIRYVNVPPAFVTSGVVIEPGSIVGKYCSHNTIIPEGSVFFKAILKTKDDMPDSALESLKEGETLVNLPVTMEKSYYNTILPNNYIDIYVKTYIKDGGTEKLGYGKLYSNVKVLAVKDSAGRNVFETLKVTRTPSTIIFAMSDENYYIMTKAITLTKEKVGADSVGVVIEPVPTSKEFAIKEEAEQISSVKLRDIIDKRITSVVE